MIIRMDIQPGKRVIPRLAEWLVAENARFFARLPADHVPGPRRLGVQPSGSLWQWQEARLMPGEQAVSGIAWAAARAAELRVRGSAALDRTDAAFGKVKAASIPAKVVLRPTGRHNRETGDLYYRVAIRYLVGGRRWYEAVETPAFTLEAPIYLHIVFGEWKSVRLLNWLAAWNAYILRRKPSLPGLYQAKVRYYRETEETWSDYVNLLLQGWEDCDALAAARAGELKARGWQALQPGDDGYKEARRRRIPSFEARVFLRTRLKPGKPGLYHCLVKYRLGPEQPWFYDDPSARLGMLDRNLNAQEVQQRLHLQKHGTRQT